MRFILELWAAKLIARIVDLLDNRRGTSFAGRQILKLDKNFISKFKGIEKEKVILITGTNGKSSTTNLITHIFRACGEKVIANLAGANLRSGIATCFIKNSRMSGRIKDGYIILEVDERTLKYILDWIPVGHLVLTNIQTDQVARNGYPEYIYNMLYDHIPEGVTLYLNNDEPRVKSFESLGNPVVYYGVDRMPCAYEKHGSLDVTQPCPKCHHRVTFDYYNLSNLGRFHCTACGHESLAKPDFLVENVDFAAGKAETNGKSFTMPYKAPFMVYNYAAAIAVARTLGLAEERVLAAYDNFVNIEGRIDQAVLGEKTIHYMRTKQENPDTLQSALDAIAADKGRKVVLLGLCTIDDVIPHYSNTFYSYDCDFDGMLAGDVEKFICFEKTTCADMANRLLLAGCPKEKIEILPTTDPEEILAAVGRCKSNQVYLITLLKIFHEIKAAAEQKTREV